MNDIMKALLEKVSSDESLQNRFKACKSAEEQVALANELGFKVTKEDLEESSKLSDQELDDVSGGGCGFNLFFSIN